METSSRTLFAATVAFLVFMLFKAVSLGLTTHAVARVQIPGTIGMGEELRARVDSLERQIAGRLEYEVSVTEDPLRLSKVVTVAAPQRKKEFAEAARPMRLSCTIVSADKSTAIIKYRGESHVLSVGDSLASMQVVSIDAKKAVLSDKGKEVVLLNEPAPPGEIRGQGRREIEGLQL